MLEACPGHSPSPYLFSSLEALCHQGDQSSATGSCLQQQCHSSVGSLRAQDSLNPGAAQLETAETMNWKTIQESGSHSKRVRFP
ncbi:unnamed protein product [Linum trigynum]|uniref:Uncharacterized protein n=1 Tax=Linum trigynum TaxID=586398 RepID=A0AAV2C8A3_9ROSI